MNNINKIQFTIICLFLFYIIDYDPKFDYSSDVVEVFSMLANEPILDYIDTKYASNTLECLLNSVAEHELVDKNMPIERYSLKKKIYKIKLIVKYFTEMIQSIHLYRK